MSTMNLVNGVNKSKIGAHLSTKSSGNASSLGVHFILWHYGGPCFDSCLGDGYPGIKPPSEFVHPDGKKQQAQFLGEDELCSPWYVPMLFDVRMTVASINMET